MSDDATPPPPMPAPEGLPDSERGRVPRPTTVLTQPADAAPPAEADSPSAPRQPFADPSVAEPSDARPVEARPTEPPVPVSDPVRRVQTAAPAPAPPPPPSRPQVRQPSPHTRAADPQAEVDTQEISLAALREAAALASAAVARDVDRHVDLVGAEEREAAELDDEAAALGHELDESGETPAPSGIDPRIRDRWVAVTRAEGRRRLRILLAVVAVASFIGIAWLVVQSPLLAVRTIRVEGTAQETQGAVMQAAGVKTGTALLFVDTGAVARRIEKLPWVAKATVDRELPNELKITVIERSPVAWARRPVPPGSPEDTLGTIVLVDRFGRVLGDSLMPPPGLPELIGMVRVPARGASIEPAAPAAAVAMLPDALRAQTGSVVRRKGQAVLQLIQPPGGAEPAAGEVRLGNLEDIDAKGASALAVLDVLAFEGDHVDYVDVRVPGAPATGD